MSAVPTAESLAFGGFVVTPASNSVTRGADVRQLNARAMDVLVYLIQHRDRVVPQEELLEEFWADRMVEEGAVHRVISQIRRALGDDARQPTFIRTVSKRGYQAIAELSAEPALDSPATAGNHRIRRIAPVAAAAAVVVLLVAAVWPRTVTVEATASLPDKERLTAVAVLPFHVMSDDTDVTHYAAGFVDALTGELAASNLSVASRTESNRTADVNDTLTGVAEHLGVAYVVEGSVQHDGERLRIIVQLIRAVDGYHVWSRAFDADAAMTLDTQGRLASTGAGIVQAMLLTDARRQHPSAWEDLRGAMPEAVALFLDGELEYNRYLFGENGDWDRSVRFMQQAAEADPNFLVAQTETAWAYHLRLNRQIPVEEAQPAAHAAIRRAIALDPDSIDVMLQLAQIHMNLDLDYERAQKVLERATEAMPDGRWWKVLQAIIAFREGRETDGLRLIDDASTVDFGAERITFLITKTVFLMFAGKNVEAAATAEAALDLTESGDNRIQALDLLGTTLARLGDLEGARTALDEAWRLGGSLTPERFSYLFAVTGDVESARSILAAHAGTPRDYLSAAMAYQALGEIDLALDELEAGVKTQNLEVLGSIRTRLWEAVHEHPRFAGLLATLESLESEARSRGREYLPAQELAAVIR